VQVFDDALDGKRKNYKLLSNQINNTKQKYAVIIRKAGALTRYFIIIFLDEIRWKKQVGKGLRVRNSRSAE